MNRTRENLRLVLIDDDTIDRELLRTSLLTAGFVRPLTELGNGEIALEYFKYTKATGAVAPHLIILHVNNRPTSRQNSYCRRQ
jgi:hypothetical protein